jgi:S1-C subfamily serine protease
MKKQEIILKNKKKIVFIGYKIKQPDNSYKFNFSGTGFVFKEKYIITCAHIYNQVHHIEGAEIFAGFLEETRTNIDTYRTHDLIYKKHNDQFDICIFELKENNYKPQETFILEDLTTDKDLEKVLPGADALFVGFPLANDFIQMGIGITLFANNTMIGAIKYSNNDNKVDFIQVDSHVNPSNSGSPLFDIESGKIIGLIFSTFNYTPQQDKAIQIPRNMGLAKPAFRILDLIEEIEK